MSSRMFTRRDHEVPGLNTASLSDLIFTALFFFMIVTHMREVQVKVKYQVPQGTELERLTKKSAVSYIYIGKPLKSEGKAQRGDDDKDANDGRETAIQLNDKLATADDVAAYIAAERSRMAPEDLKKMTVSIRADRHTRMGVVTEVKQALRKAGALKVNYSAEQSKR